MTHELLLCCTAAWFSLSQVGVLWFIILKDISESEFYFIFDFFISTYVMMVKGCLVCTNFFVQNVCSHQDNYTLHRNYKGNLELALRSRNYWKKIPWYHEKNALKRGNRQTAISNDKQLLLIERIVTKNQRNSRNI